MNYTRLFLAGLLALSTGSMRAFDDSRNDEGLNPSERNKSVSVSNQEPTHCARCNSLKEETQNLVIEQQVKEEECTLLLKTAQEWRSKYYESERELELWIARGKKDAVEVKNTLKERWGILVSLDENTYRLSFSEERNTLPPSALNVSKPISITSPSVIQNTTHPSSTQNKQISGSNSKDNTQEEEEVSRAKTNKADFFARLRTFLFRKRVLVPVLFGVGSVALAYKKCPQFFGKIFGSFKGLKLNLRKSA